MNTYLVTIHLEGGGSASIKQTANDDAALAAAARNAMNGADPMLTLAFQDGRLEVRRDKVIGWSVSRA
ncbi:MAG: hypothetical protein IPK22_10960 [Verrucomicrobiaceae bacterium]|nr:hypothetical protein [Verrucomicrobiaceae bacterium]